MRFAIAQRPDLDNGEEDLIYLRSVARHYPGRLHQYSPAKWTYDVAAALTWANRSTAEKHLPAGCTIVELPDPRSTT